MNLNDNTDSMAQEHASIESRAYIMRIKVSMKNLLQTI
jgi:hypothetical protein